MTDRSFKPHLVPVNHCVSIPLQISVYLIEQTVTYFHGTIKKLNFKMLLDLGMKQCTDRRIYESGQVA